MNVIILKIELFYSAFKTGPKTVDGMANSEVSDEYDLALHFLFRAICPNRIFMVLFFTLFQTLMSWTLGSPQLYSLSPFLVGQTR